METYPEFHLDPYRFQVVRFNQESTERLRSAILGLIIVLAQIVICGRQQVPPPSKTQPLADWVAIQKGLVTKPVISEDGKDGKFAHYNKNTGKSHIHESAVAHAFGAVDELGQTIAHGVTLYHELLHGALAAAGVECGGPGANSLTEITSPPPTASKCCHLAIYAISLAELCQIIEALRAADPVNGNLPGLCAAYHRYAGKLGGLGAECAAAGHAPVDPQTTNALPPCPGC